MSKTWNKCPKCKSEEISVTAFESDEDTAWRTATCDNCNFEWQEIFNFDHNEDFDCNTLDDTGEPE
jgi:transposase-like protein